MFQNVYVVQQPDAAYKLPITNLSTGIVHNSTQVDQFESYKIIQYTAHRFMFFFALSHQIICLLNFTLLLKTFDVLNEALKFSLKDCLCDCSN